MKVKHKMSSYHTLVLHMAMTGILNDLKPKQSHIRIALKIRNNNIGSSIGENTVCAEPIIILL